MIQEASTERQKHAQEPLVWAVLASQRLQASILWRVFGALGGLLLFVLAWERVVEGSVRLPVVAVPFAFVFAAEQYGLYRFIGRRIEERSPVPEWVWYAAALLEVTLVTAAIVLVARTWEPRLFALLAPPVFVYFLLILFSTLRLNPWLSRTTGAVAAVEYLGTALVVLRADPPGVDLPAIFTGPAPYFMISALMVAGGVGAGFIAREIRERVERTAAVLRERDRVEAADRAKSAFLANVSHEIRTPLNAVLGYAQVLEADPSLSEDQRQAVQTIGGSGHHLLRLIDQVLDLARIEAGRTELVRNDFHAPALLRDLSSLFGLRCRRKGLSWDVDVAPDLGLVRGDEGKLRQILINLVENAVRMTERGGIRLAASREGDLHRFVVSDTGPGIHPDRHRAIFEPFQQERAGTRTEGTGLGLAIAQAHAELMSGSLVVESEPGAGATFTLELPLSPASGAAAPGPVGKPLQIRLAPGARVSALVVDDLRENREVLAALLERVGVDVRLAEGGEEAVHLATERAPDIVFLDVRMPGLDGPATLARLQGAGLRDGIRVVAVSSSVLEHERRAVSARGFDAFLRKPLSAEALYDCIGDLLGVRFAPLAPPPPSTMPVPDVGGYAVRGALWDALRMAAADSSVTDLTAAIAELEAEDEGARPLAHHLRGLARRYEMDAILSVLDEVPRA